MTFCDWFKSQCSYCFEKYNERDQSQHGKGICHDKRRLWNMRILKKNNKYIVQGKYYYVEDWAAYAYWDELKTFKTLRMAKKYKIKWLEDHNQHVVG